MQFDMKKTLVVILMAVAYLAIFILGACLTGYVMSLGLTLPEEPLWFMLWKWGGLHNW